ncbi:hypothetical protein A7X87_05980 [Stenotrophomonas maltophilia]|nr:hypothetical protein A7X87_05980 [Stenotrophomonas maltophilia]
MRFDGDLRGMRLNESGRQARKMEHWLSICVARPGGIGRQVRSTSQESAAQSLAIAFEYKFSIYMDESYGIEGRASDYLIYFSLMSHSLPRLGS